MVLRVLLLTEAGSRQGQPKLNPTGLPRTHHDLGQTISEPPPPSRFLICKKKKTGPMVPAFLPGTLFQEAPAPRRQLRSLFLPTSKQLPDHSLLLLASGDCWGLREPGQKPLVCEEQCQLLFLE